MDKRKTWTKDEEAFVVNNYLLLGKEDLLKGLPTKSWNAIKQKAVRLGVAKKKVSCHGINHDYFAKVTLESAYWAGFIAADGCLKGGFLRVRLSKKDEAHLISGLKSALGFSGEIQSQGARTKGVRYESSLLKCKSTSIIRDLTRQFGVTPTKSEFLLPKKLLGEDFNKAFIVGFIDGDGCILRTGRGGNYMGLDLIGTEECLLYFSNLLNEYFPTNKPIKVRPVKGVNAFRYRISGKRCTTILNSLMGLSLPRLERKWSKVNGSSRTDSVVATVAGTGRSTTGLGRIPTPETRDFDSARAST